MGEAAHACIAWEPPCLGDIGGCRGGHNAERGRLQACQAPSIHHHIRAQQRAGGLVQYCNLVRYSVC